MQSSQRRSPRIPSIESLEFRKLLSGNVTVTADANLNAQIVGDKGNNQIVITLNSGGGYLITGLKGTKVNGSPAVSINTQSAMNITVNLGAGNDRITFDGSAASGGAFATQALSVDTGKGNDIVTVSGTTHFGSVALSTGDGNDSVVLDSIHVTNDLSILTGKGNDAVAIATATQVDGNASIDAGAGKNRLSGTTSLNVTGNTTIAGVSSTQEKKADKPKKAKKETKDSEDQNEDKGGKDD
jgi:hypothetical protein